jgi:hypothetical protein
MNAAGIKLKGLVITLLAEGTLYEKGANSPIHRADYRRIIEKASCFLIQRGL